jgi:hypothetical protein
MLSLQQVGLFVELGPWICRACLAIETAITSVRGAADGGKMLIEEATRLRTEVGQGLVRLHTELDQRKKRDGYVRGGKQGHRGIGREYLDGITARLAAMMPPSCT